MPGTAKMLLLQLISISIPLFSLSQQLSLTRQYKAGETYRYRMTTDVIHNGKWQSSIIAVCELTVVMDSANIPYDEIKWISKKVYTARDTTDHTDEIRNTSPYRISLHKNGKLDLPVIQDAGMTGEITDFNTFFVAISPKLGINELHKPQDIFYKPERVKGNFSNGKDILRGEDCLTVTNTLLRTDYAHAWIKTEFKAPADTCLSFYSSDMKQPVTGDTINNFQMVRFAGPGKVNLFYGKEVFTIASTLDLKDGRLKAAAMNNTLRLNLKLNCNTDYTDCQNSFPFTIQRNVQLELVR
ncbi:hypothetical protein [Pseudoflavitalea rhizosphaerae]|uniref:hypothetical protein n=1 Tax=Pseudoflavitalea rhizosphaerae TaxID=1884793 RepID=UPI000F8CC901|nr:hypothetical protein [Pseudoflavitalea rhizosphaerae]